jgi:hypothetical protein
MRFLTAKFVRFSLVALLSAAVYSIAVAVMVSLLKLDGKLANVIGYVSALPLNFGHRRFTFLVDGHYFKGGNTLLSPSCGQHWVSTAGFSILVDAEQRQPISRLTNYFDDEKAKSAMRLKQLLNAPQVYQKFQEAGGFFRARLRSIEDYLEFEDAASA